MHFIEIGLCWWNGIWVFPINEIKCRISQQTSLRTFSHLGFYFRVYHFVRGKTRFSRKRNGEKQNFGTHRAFWPPVRSLDGKRRCQRVIRRCARVNEHLWPRNFPAKMNPQFSVTRDTCRTSKLIGGKAAWRRPASASSFEIGNEESRRALICSSNSSPLIVFIYDDISVVMPRESTLASAINVKPRF